ncbi:transcriptional activator RfaH [Carnimonas nigrificans]|uniref:transcriptional activator RfaH n=1 Tax=Carnimonas nigrificans TaxID=64323 RepID=UPI0004B8C39E|nr:transcriptional activator RfaH [Carnimonas nigrificans]
MTGDQNEKSIYRWYAIQCKGGESLRAAENLHRQGFEIFHPLVAKNEKKARREPLFPYYLFIRLSQVASNWRPIRSTRGVLRLVSFGDTPLPVPQSLIDMLKAHASMHDGDPINHYIGLKPRLQPTSDSTSAKLSQLLDKRSGEERVIALLDIISRIQDPRAL